MTTAHKRPVSEEPSEFNEGKERRLPPPWDSLPWELWQEIAKMGDVSIFLALQLVCKHIRHAMLVNAEHVHKQLGYFHVHSKPGKRSNLTYARHVSFPIHATNAWLVHLTVTQEGVDIIGCKKITDAGMLHLQRAQVVYLDTHKITNDGLKHVSNARKVVLAWGHSNHITTQGLWHLRHVPELDFEGMGRLVTNECLEWFKDARTLNLNTCWTICDRGLQHLANVQWLSITSVSVVTDMGLGYLKSIQNIDLFGAQWITDAGMQHLSACSAIGLGNCQTITDAGLRYLESVPHISVAWNRNITDSGIMQLKNIQSLNVRGCKNITDAGIQRLQQARPGVKIHK